MTLDFSLHHHFWGTRFTVSYDWGSSPGHRNWKLHPMQILPHFSIFVCLNSSHSSQLGQMGQLEMGPACCAVHKYTLVTVAKARSQGRMVTANQRPHRELTSDLQHPCSLKCQPHPAGIPSLSASAYLGWKHSCRNKSHRSGTRTEFLVSWTSLRSVGFASHLSSGKLHLPHPDKLLFQQSCPRALCHQEVCELKSEREVRVHQLPALSTK